MGTPERDRVTYAAALRHDIAPWHEQTERPRMDPTEILVAEHRVIRSGLSVLLGMARRAERQQPLPVERARDMISFLHRYIDNLHHPKEDDILFPALGEIGLPRNAGPIASLVHEHELGRVLLERMAETIDEGLTGESAARFAQDARRYVTMMRAHTDKEDRQIFPLARKSLPELLRRRIDESFRRHRVSQAAEQERCLALLEPLIALITPARQPSE